METESKYLKKIRDVLRKKNAGSSSGTIYSGPNTKAKYLNDIAKEVDKLDISGGGSSESPVFVFAASQTEKNGQLNYDNGVTRTDIINAYNSGKVVICKANFNYGIDGTRKASRDTKNGWLINSGYEKSLILSTVIYENGEPHNLIFELPTYKESENNNTMFLYEMDFQAHDTYMGLVVHCMEIPGGVEYIVQN